MTPFIYINSIIKTLQIFLKQNGVDAIHAGYGFLSESGDFAKACYENGIIFIGPSPDVMYKMVCFYLNLIIFLTYFILSSFYKGNKTEARKAATEAGEIKLFLFFRN